jgi:hypothetical protein
MLLVVEEPIHLAPELARQAARVGRGAQGVARLVPLVLGGLARQLSVARPLEHVGELGGPVRDVHARETTGA